MSDQAYRHIDNHGAATPMDWNAFQAKLNNAQKLEDIAPLPHDYVMASIAASLRRIADALWFRPFAPISPPTPEAANENLPNDGPV